MTLFLAGFTFVLVITTLDKAQGEPLIAPLCVNPVTSDMVAYDPTREMCCDGTLHDVRTTTGQNCCGKQILDNLSHMCCGQEAIPIYDKKRCCGGTIVYDSETQMCCGNNVYAKSDDYNMCCGNYPMNTLQDTCCHVIGSSGLTSLPSKGRGQCCGLDLTYDPETQMCCQGQTEDAIVSEVVPKNDEVACCGGRAYSTSHQLCCAGIVLNATSGRTECCGNTAYNPDNEHCCAETVFPIGHGKCCGDRAYHPSGASCCQGVLHDGIPEVTGVQACCGPLSYLESESICCAGEIHDKAPGLECCGKDAFNSNTQLCCAGNILPKSSQNDACCGRASYDLSTETCCTGGDGESDGQTFPLAGGRCCHTEHGNVVAYDPSKATCCTAGNRNGILYTEVAANASVCCGRYLLDESTHLCDPNAGHPIRKATPADNHVCSNTNWRRSRTYNSITQVCSRGRIRSKNRVVNLNGCGPFTRDPDTQICCMGRIHPNEDRHGNPRFCCRHSIRSYVPQHQTCCSGRVDNIPAQTSKCCRNKAYNTATHTCDRNGIVRQTSEMALFPLLCGSKPYHPSEHECCGGVLIGPGQTCCRGAVYETSDSLLGEGRCCGGVKGYNPGRDLCCGDIIHENVNQGTLCCGSETWHPQDSDHICCDGRLQSTSGGVRRSCSGGTAYNIMTETVCDGVVHPQSNGICCGKFVYDDSREICCRENVYPKETPHTLCCGALTYDPTDSQQRCCDGSLHRDTSGSRCCGNQLFHPSNQLCCFHTASHSASYILSANGNRNCGSLLDARGTMHVNCSGTMHVATENGECCRDAYISDAQTQMCCEGNIVPKLYGANSICCGGAVVDSAVTRC
ncbi:uncharacterized protein LOC119742004 [Patiria miniata]|uniref:Galaxin-like repeats domain-containing protein n=1 Tax=Patiria miniata TaxID=46514 RepID=A0A914BD50_PATMI|nr:uncharacterized protein LOC119742004 [Patiria miniata]